ncbi:hypothetical protein ACFRAU_14190 [Arthrobacter sp. NPDC056691]|uniref:hypothetical protein n=1 Tax=Arthrobacter sp. NPDC056691 TaxID=3345913 RepID=UPI003670C1E4
MSKNRLKDRSAASSRDGVAQAGRVDPLQDVLTSLNLRLTVSDLKAALEAMRRENSAADLPARDRNFWAAHSGINTDPTPPPRAVLRGTPRHSS